MSELLVLRERIQKIYTSYSIYIGDKLWQMLIMLMKL